jgi:hypothetical protein
MIDLVKVINLVGKWEARVVLMEENGFTGGEIAVMKKCLSEVEGLLDLEVGRDEEESE